MMSTWYDRPAQSSQTLFSGFRSAWIGRINGVQLVRQINGLGPHPPAPSIQAGPGRFCFGLFCFFNKLSSGPLAITILPPAASPQDSFSIGSDHFTKKLNGSPLCGFSRRLTWFCESPYSSWSVSPAVCTSSRERLRFDATPAPHQRRDLNQEKGKIIV